MFVLVFRLRRPVPVTEKMQPIRLPLTNRDYFGHMAFVSGWGIQNRRNARSSNLKAAELTVIPSVDSPTCRAQSGWGKMCAVPGSSPRGGSVCPGDSGSPLVVWDEEMGGWTLVGLLSNGAKSCFRGLPAVYTRVGDYLDWIYDTVRSYGQVP